MRPLPGLPWVCAPLRGEWLGYWLLRVGEPYGITVSELFARARVEQRLWPKPTWARLRILDRQALKALAKTLGEQTVRLDRMQILISTPTRYGELAYCPRCLLSDRERSRTRYWRRDWMDPYFVWCEHHRAPLRGVEAKRVRPLQRVADSTECLAELSKTDRVPCRSPESDVLAEFAADAHWLSRALRSSAASWYDILLPRSCVDHIVHLIIGALERYPSHEALVRLLNALQSLAAPIELTATPHREGLLAATRAVAHRVALLGLAARLLGMAQIAQKTTEQLRATLWTAFDDSEKRELASAFVRAQTHLPCRPWKELENWRPPTFPRRSILPSNSSRWTALADQEFSSGPFCALH